jgi:hypothetical protein
LVASCRGRLPVVRYLLTLPQTDLLVTDRNGYTAEQFAGVCDHVDVQNAIRREVRTRARATPLLSSPHVVVPRTPLPFGVCMQSRVLSGRRCGGCAQVDGRAARWSPLRAAWVGAVAAAGAVAVAQPPAVKPLKRSRKAH